ncbi:MAG: hypothetical protein IJQ37_04070 [Clostridia bacterium]|nr:hypothetical protein [Clostridia bacterium]
MKNTIKKELQDLNKSFVKEYAKKHKYKSIADWPYAKIDDAFIWILFHPTYNKGIITVRGLSGIKPYSFDDLFWDIFDMSSNKNAPMSLRCNGAYTCPSDDICWIERKTENFDDVYHLLNDIARENDAAIEKYISETKEKYKCIEERFLTIPDPPDNRPPDDAVLLRVLANIYFKNYEDALKIINDYPRCTGGFATRFINKDKTITDKTILQYCEEFCLKNQG